LGASLLVIGRDSSSTGDGSGKDGKPTSGKGFETPWPGTSAGSPIKEVDSLGTVGGGAPARNPGINATDKGNADAVRAIEEADIISLDGDRLFALLRVSGLNVVDVSNPDALRVVGRCPDTHSAEPFELYLRDGVALVMFSDWGKYVPQATGNGFVYVQTSEVIALDVRDPARIKQFGA
jgi:hypothetical protein